jgi:hypothetical protein
MRRFVAQAHGALIGQAPWSGQVLSLHPRAVNILRADGLAVSVVADRWAMSAMAVLSNELFEPPLETTVVDMPARMDQGVISFDDFISVDCAKSPPWEGCIELATVPLMTVERIHAICAALFTWGKPGGLLGVLRNDPPENPFVTWVRDSLRRGRAEDLVGSGPGLTPAGDDFLTGAMLASSESDILDRPRLKRALAGTTPLGRTLLWMAMQGRFPAYLVDFLQISAVTGASRDEIDDAVRAACAHGGTSGTDALTGFSWRMLMTGCRIPVTR